MQDLNLFVVRFAKTEFGYRYIMCIYKLQSVEVSFDMDNDNEFIIQLIVLGLGR